MKLFVCETDDDRLRKAVDTIAPELLVSKRSANPTPAPARSENRRGPTPS